MKKLLVTVSAAALGGLAALPLACGSVAATPNDAAAADGIAAPDDATADASDDTLGASLDAQRERDASYDAPSWPTDAACGEGGLASGDGGATFTCMGAPCGVDSEYCGLFSGGRIVPFAYPNMGCHPLPCECAPARGCACLEPLPDYCACNADNGAITVSCALP